MKKELGFTLVELAIVMIIIGLLIGGILKGQELIENAKIKATITQIKSYEAAVLTFKDKYSTIPGDTIHSTRIPNCTGVNFCRAGNGDNIIGMPGNNIIDVSGNTENTQFWKHLALSDIITGVNGTSNPIESEWGNTHPKSKFQGGFQIYFNNQPHAHNGHWLRMQPQVVGGFTEIPGDYALPPMNAAIIDRKIDDGIPNSGYVRAIDAGPGVFSGCEGTEYDLNETSYNCILLSYIGFR